MIQTNSHNFCNSRQILVNFCSLLSRVHNKKIIQSDVHQLPALLLCLRPQHQLGAVDCLFYGSNEGLSGIRTPLTRTSADCLRASTGHDVMRGPVHHPAGRRTSSHQQSPLSSRLHLAHLDVLHPCTPPWSPFR